MVLRDIQIQGRVVNRELWDADGCYCSFGYDSTILRKRPFKSASPMNVFDPPSDAPYSMGLGVVGTFLDGLMALTFALWTIRFAGPRWFYDRLLALTGALVFAPVKQIAR